MTDDEINGVIRAFSASLPLRAERGHVYAWPGARPWNGRQLHPFMATGCADVFNRVFHDTGSAYEAAQSAFEWLSEYC